MRRRSAFCDFDFRATRPEYTNGGKAFAAGWQACQRGFARSLYTLDQMDVCVIDHPLAAARLTVLRDERTDTAGFRAALRDLTLMLVYEASRDAPRKSVRIRTPVAAAAGTRLVNPPLLVPVLRAGLGMVDGAGRAARGRGGLRRRRPRRANPPAGPVFGGAARQAGRQAGDGAGPDAGHRRLDGAHPGAVAASRRHRHYRAVCGGRAGRSCGGWGNGARRASVHCRGRQGTQQGGLHRARPRRCRGSPIRAEPVHQLRTVATRSSRRARARRREDARSSLGAQRISK